MPCPYCATAMPKNRSAHCGSVDCRREFNRIRTQKYLADYLATHGVRYEDRYKVEKACARCGKAFRTRPCHGSERCEECQVGDWQRTGGRASGAKAKAAREARLLPVLAGPVRVAETLRYQLALAKVATAAEGTRSKNAIYVSGRCVRDGKPFVCLLTNTPPKWCSKRCARADQKALARTLANEAAFENFAAEEIFERDGWRCRIPGCGKPVRRGAEVPHHLAPTLDHIVPRSQGGDHTRANVRCAHFICNSRRGNRGGNDQLLLVG